MKKIVIAGGTHCGKTTLIGHYQSLGYPIVPESGIQIITEMKDRMGLEEYREWRQANPKPFFELIEERQIDAETKAPTEGDFLFLDRGMQDTIVMEKYTGIAPSERALEYARTIRYDTIFICEVLPNFDNRQNTGRTFTHEDSLKLTELAYLEYKAHGYEPIRVPPISLEERIALINKEIGIN